MGGGGGGGLGTNPTSSSPSYSPLPSVHFCPVLPDRSWPPNEITGRAPIRVPIRVRVPSGWVHMGLPLWALAQ